MQYQTIAASQTNSVVGTSGTGPGDWIERLIVIVATAATAAVSLADGGGTAIDIMPNSPGGGVGVYPVTLNMQSRTGKWTVTTGAGSSVIVVGVWK